MKSYKAIIHYNKNGSKLNKPWTIHFRGTCYLVSTIKCLVPIVSEFKPNKKTNQRAFFTVQIQKLSIKKDNAILS